MNVCTCFLLFGIFAYTNSSYLRQPINGERHVKKARRADREFNIKENLQNVFDTTDKTVTGDNDTPTPYSNVETFTDFIEELINILNTYNDDTFEDFVDILDKVIRKYHNRHCKYYDLKGKHEFRSLMAAKLDSFAELTLKEKREEINKILLVMRLQTLNKNIKDFLDYVNSLYKNDTKGRFRIILTALKSYDAGYSDLNTKDDFINIVRECIKATVFYHTDLSSDVRVKLKTYVEMIMNNVNFLIPTNNTAKFNHFEPTAKELDTTIVKIPENISTANNNKIYEASLKTEPTRTTEYIKEKNKRITMFKTETNETQSEDETKLRETSKNERNSEQKAITYSNTENVMEEMFFMTTEKPGIVFKSEIRSKLVERMLGDPAGTVAIAKTTTMERLSSSKKQDLRRSIAPPLPGEELSIEIFDRESRRIKKKSVPGSNNITTERYELNNYNKLRRHLEKKVDRLKKIDNIKHDIKAKGKGDNDGRDRGQKNKKESMKKYLKKEKERYETKDKKHRNKRKERKKTKNSELVSGEKSNENDGRVLRNKNKVKNTEDGVRKIKNTSNEKEDEHKLKRKDESIENNKNPAHKLRNKKKITKNRSKKTKKQTTTCNCDTKDAETSTKPSKKKAVLKSIQPLATTIDNTNNKTDINEILEKTILNATNKVDNTITKISKALKQNRIDDTAIDSNVKVTEDNINEETSTQRYRRVFKSFPSIFKGETLKEGFFPAHLWD